MMLAGTPGLSHALPYTGVDITLKAIEYSDIIGINDPDCATAWFTFGKDAIFTYKNFRWVEYEVELTAGNWNIGLNVINRGYVADDDWIGKGFVFINSCFHP